MRIILILFAAFLLAGCGKKPEASAPSTQAQAVTTSALAAQQQSYTPAPVVNSASASPGPADATPAPDLTRISLAVRGWLLNHGRPPTNFEEFAATASIPIPPPPAGKKYAFDSHLRVMLVDINQQ